MNIHNEMVYFKLQAIKLKNHCYLAVETAF